MKKIQYIFLAIIIISTIISCKKDDENETPEVGVKIGAIAPDFEIADVEGNLHKLSDYRGGYVVVDFWAAWCSICRAENPKMQNLYTKYKDNGLVVLGVSLGPSRTNWLQAIQDDGLGYIQLGDTDAFNSEVAQTYGLGGVPLMLLLNPEGEILIVSSKVSDIEAGLVSVY